MSKKRKTSCPYSAACFGNKLGKCTILTDTEFKNRVRCPFFKTAERLKAEQEAAQKRLKRLAFGAQLLAMYGNEMDNEKDGV